MHLVAIAAITPKAAIHGAKRAPITHTIAGISSSIFSFSFLTIILVTFPS
ncbi:MAG: hypothetical protein QXF09_03135 [Nitrososphaerota archaeon]